MTDEANIFTTEWERETGSVRGARLGPRAGSGDLGCSVVELDPGGQLAPYHLHHANEELLIVLSGTPELRTPEGTRTLAPGEVVAFPTGADGAHRVRNASDEPCRYLMVSTMVFPEVAEQLDIGAVLAMTAAGDGWAWAEGSDRPYMELLAEALAADGS